MIGSAVEVGPSARAQEPRKGCLTCGISREPALNVRDAQGRVGGGPLGGASEDGHCRLNTGRTRPNVAQHVGRVRVMQGGFSRSWPEFSHRRLGFDRIRGCGCVLPDLGPTSGESHAEPEILKGCQCSKMLEKMTTMALTASAMTLRMWRWRR